jgi:hypothetical protein
LLQAPIFHPAAGCLAWASHVNAAVPPRSLTDMSFERCRNGAAGNSSAEGSKHLPGPTIFLGPFPPLSVAPHGQTRVTSSVLSCSELILNRRFLGDFHGFRHGLCLFWS